MNLENLNLTPAAIAIIAFVAMVVIIIAISTIISTVKTWKLKRSTVRAIKKEDERIAGLPKLDTRYLIKIPISVTRFAKGEPRTFGNRYNRLIVFDENGDGWLGLFMPSTFRSLRDGEYIQKNYWVPFRGDGEMYAGDHVIIDGQRVSIYPIWMNASNTNTVDWKKWAEFEKAFTEAHRDRSSSDDFKQFTPFERSHGLESKRKAFETMRDSVAPRKKMKTAA